MTMSQGRKNAPTRNGACRGCYYLGSESTCDYLLKTKTRRPCPPGAGCTVKITNKQKRTVGLEIASKKTIQRAKRGRQPLLDGDERVERMYAEGKTDNEIATIMNCSKVTVQKWRYRTGRPSNQKHGRSPKKE